MTGPGPEHLARSRDRTSRAHRRGAAVDRADAHTTIPTTLAP
jgi:hypothetical protein